MTNTCTHVASDRWVWQDVEVSPWGDTEPQLVNVGGESLSEDIGIGRFRCKRCGAVGYYTGLWRAFHEEGKPCSGSDRLRPAGVPAKRW